jgi:hypothetical protein
VPQLLPGLDLDSLPGPKRGVSPAIYFRDEAVFSPSGRYFALAYTIVEVSMGNEIGCLLWGRIADRETTILGNPEGVYATCWYSPWANWLDDETFAFKAQRYDGKRLHLPLVVIRIGSGFTVLPGTSHGRSRPFDITFVPAQFELYEARSLLHAINTSPVKR